MKKQLLNATILALTVALAACSKPYEVDTTGVEGVAGENVVDDVYASGQTTSSVGDFYEDPSYGVNVVGGPSAGEKDRVIYFSFDSSALDSRSVAVVEEHAKYLRAHPNVQVVLEGHTDERGSREYNIGLGERRAYSVKGHFERLGVNPSQMRALSYGEENPAADCSSESCYAKNRRVVIVY